MGRLGSSSRSPFFLLLWTPNSSGSVKQGYTIMINLKHHHYLNIWNSQLGLYHSISWAICWISWIKFPDNFPFFQIHTGSFTGTKHRLELLPGSPDLLAIHHSMMYQRKAYPVSSSQHKLLCNWFFSDFSMMPKRFWIWHWSPLKMQAAFTERCFSVSECGVLLCVCTPFT